MDWASLTAFTRPVRHPLLSWVDWWWGVCGYSWASTTDRHRLLSPWLMRRSRTIRLRVLEWGGGRSTLWYPAYLLRHGFPVTWVTVEQESAWATFLASHIRTRGLSQFITLLTVPAPREATPSRYLTAPRTYAPFDLILIDGMARAACLQTAKRYLAPEGWVWVHDAHRREYQAALETYTTGVWQVNGRMPGSGPFTLSWLGQP